MNPGPGDYNDATEVKKKTISPTSGMVSKTNKFL